MSQPTVACIMLVNGRQEMVVRAIRSFHSQTYEGLALFCLDTGERQAQIMDAHGVYSEYYPGLRIDRYSVGKLRNAANDFAKTLNAEIILHWDSDDWSHPNRIAEQVALLQLSGKQCVGYRDMLFWRVTGISYDLIDVTKAGLFGGPADTHKRYIPGLAHESGEAWLYGNPDTSYCLGASLCYWRSVWEARPFPDLPKKKGGTGEDVEWLKGVDSLGVSAFCNPQGLEVDRNWRMIASIHGDNTQYYGPDLLGASTSWKRVPEWDAVCREKMA